MGRETLLQHMSFVFSLAPDLLSAIRIDPAKPCKGFGDTLWIITEHDRRLTTLLLPD